jgi:hypothetical protein
MGAGCPLGVMPVLPCTDTKWMGQTTRPAKPASGRTPVASRTSLVVLGVLLGVERLITLKWDVPRWSVFVYVLLVIALVVQRVLAPSQPLSSALRPLTFVAVAIAVVTTVLVALSDARSDKWGLLVWLLPAATASADRLMPRLPPDVLPGIAACLFAVVIVAQFGLIWQAHNTHARADAFHDRIAQICADAASLSSRPTTEWIVANDSMLRQLQTLTPPDVRTRKLTGYLIAELQGAEASFNYNDPSKQREWQESARDTARYLGINRSCGVF